MHNFKSFGVSFKTLTVNGIDFFSFEKPSAPIFVSVFFHAGSKFNEKDGAAHFLEHMLSAGSEKFPSKNLLADYIENTGGEFSLSTNSDFIRIDLEIAEPQDSPVLVDILDQMVNKSLFNEETFSKEKTSILSELANKTSNQKEFVWEVWRELFFQNTALSQSNLGSEESIKTTMVNDLLLFKNKYFLGGKVSVIMAGGLQTEKMSTDLARVLGEKHTIIQNDTKVPMVREKWFDTEFYPSKLASVVFGFRTNTKTLKDEVCAAICAEYLAGGRASELITKLRYERGLVYNVGVINRCMQNGSAFAVRTDCEVDNLEQVLSIINKSFQNLHEFAISEEKLRDLKSRITKFFIIELQTSKSWVVNNERLVVANDGKSIIDFLSAVNEVSVGDIKKYVQRNFLLEKKYIAACGPEQVAEVIKKFGSNL